ncbi:MAG: CDP-glucose 4,6-dehydratase [Bacteroidota bacterium]
MSHLFGGCYNNKVCLVTGHTGFKGSWLVFWLKKMGAKVVGYALEPENQPNHFSLLDKEYTSTIGDVLDEKQLQEVIHRHKPEIIFHLAAQSLVRYSYQHPLDTFRTNIIGTTNVFETARKSDSVKAIVNITSDKCYENKEWIWGYRENDAMGGHDPYSASKGCAELVTNSYEKSFFNTGQKLLASARAGNVIGGGDWCNDRLVPDLVRAASRGEKCQIRNPLATRPWQHVLEPLSGYLLLGWRLLQNKKSFSGGWNFGPDLNSNLTVQEVVNEAKRNWMSVEVAIDENENVHHEANLLMLDCSKSNKLLKWNPVWDFEKTMTRTILWYKDFYEKEQLRTEDDFNEYIFDAKEKRLVWT